MQFYVIWNLQVLSHSLSVWAIPDIKKYRLNIFVQSSCNFLLKISEIKIIASEKKKKECTVVSNVWLLVR